MIIGLAERPARPQAHSSFLATEVIERYVSINDPPQVPIGNFPRSVYTFKGDAERRSAIEDIFLLRISRIYFLIDRVVQVRANL